MLPQWLQRTATMTTMPEQHGHPVTSPAMSSCDGTPFPPAGRGPTVRVGAPAPWHPSPVASAWVATNEHTVVSLGDEGGDHVALEFHRRERAEPETGGWVPPLTTSASVSVGAFAATCSVAIREEELIAFRRQLTRVCASQDHEAVLQSQDERLGLRLRVQPLGGVVVLGHASDDLRDGCTLAFALRGLDQRCLPRLLRKLRQVEVELGIRPPTNGQVEVRSRYNGTWVPGFEVAEVFEVDAERLFRLRRCSDGVVLPTHFGPDEVRVPIE
jgi:hypothetical protein